MKVKKLFHPVGDDDKVRFRELNHGRVRSAQNFAHGLADVLRLGRWQAVVNNNTQPVERDPGGCSQSPPFDGRVGDGLMDESRGVDKSEPTLVYFFAIASLSVAKTVIMASD